jgi:poly(A) polymerase
MAEVSPERILEEMNHILLSRQPSAGLELLGRWKVFTRIMPEIQAMVGFRQNNPFHFPDLFRHTLRVVDRCHADLSLRWSALLHDCGKPATRTLTDGTESYHGHEAVGSELAAKLLKRLKAGRKLTKEVSDLVNLHMVHYQDEWSDRAVRRFIRRSGDYLEKLLVLVEADSASGRLRKNKLRDLQKLRRRIESVLKSMSSPRSPLTGDQIMEILNIGPGCLVGMAKDAIIDAVVDGDIAATEDDAREFLIKWWQGAAGTPS